jgi:hypothetical protein
MFGKAGSATNLRVPHPLRSLQSLGYVNACIEILGFHPSQNARRTPDFLLSRPSRDQAVLPLVSNGGRIQ